MHIFQGAVQNIHVNSFAHLIVVQRTVPVRNDIASGMVCREGRIRKELRSFIFSFINAPHLQKHQGKTSHRITFQHNGGIFPMPEFLFFINVFIRQINSAVKCRMPIDHQNLPVIPVIIVGGDKGRDRGKHFAFYSKGFQPFRIIVGKQGEFAGPVVHDADVYALRGLFREYFQYAAPHQSFIDNKIFHKNEMLRRFQLLQHFFKLIFPKRKVSNGRMFEDGITSASGNIMSQRGSSRIFNGKTFHNFR